MNSENGFQTNVWGAPMWLCLHLISLNYKPEMKKGYKQFFNSLQYVLPCGACRRNYSYHINNTLPLTDNALKCRKSMSMWVFFLHNAVQRSIFIKTQDIHDKPKYEDTTTDFTKAMAFYESFRAKCCKTSHGCTVPLKGSRKRSKIHIVKFSKPRKANAIKNSSK